MPITLSIAQFHKHGASNNTLYWCLAATTPGTKVVQAFELVGDNHQFGINTKNINLSKSTSLCGGCYIGEAQDDSLEWIATRIRGVPVLNGEPGWRNSNWAMEAVRELQQEQRENASNPRVKILPEISLKTVAEELKEEFSIAELGDPHFYDRFFATQAGQNQS
ncbi:hypothetical protein BDV98DRAFT_120493 [Pterulicium gracile]|uniref:Uncharacterized protein n=1 Tax=Pterulicium gracile TaxID=1884261 RepID=A0A5C3QFX8_9AGAR|nr:hypothetical protein BDV98DRAFT_120493 [Pterula gracilis]